jgi:hypothetical protein
LPADDRRADEHGSDDGQYDCKCPERLAGLDEKPDLRGEPADQNKGKEAQIDSFSAKQGLDVA